MTLIRTDDYAFEVNVEETVDYYKIHSLCKCDHCQNFYSRITGKFPKLENFLAEFGIEISKPDEITSVESDGIIDYLSVDYTVCGKIIAMGKYEIDIHDNLFLSIVVTDGFVSPNEQKNDYFTISVYGIMLNDATEHVKEQPIYVPKTMTKINKNIQENPAIFCQIKRNPLD